MGELERRLSEQGQRDLKREAELQEFARISRERSAEFIVLATRKRLAKTALYTERSIVTPKKSTWFNPVDRGRSGRSAVNDVAYSHRYIDSGWLSVDTEDTSMLILPNNNVYACALPLRHAPRPLGIRHDSYVTVPIHENSPLTPLEAPFWNEQGLERLVALLQTP